MARTIYWDDGAAMVLDQTKLPHEVTYVRCTNHLMVAECIKNMRIRGAPAIGIAAAMGIALGAKDAGASSYDDLAEGLEEVYRDLLATRPTAVNIEWAVDRMRFFLERHRAEPVDRLRQMLAEEAQRVLEEDIEVNRAIGRFGAVFIKDGARVLTHCNAGGLATGGYGTATAPMRVAQEEGKRIHVYADETRPLLQGARLTAWELKEAGIPVTLITDNCAGALMSRGEIDLVIVGTDRTARNGDVANKIGTYMVAVLAKENGIPFYVAAPTSSIDFSMPSGDMIPIEERASEEVTDVHGKLKIAPEGIMVRNLAFDVTPARYVTAIITEKGAFRPGDLKHLAEAGADLDEYRLQDAQQ
ncbi:MAG: S-methyl-5-thioribose-1-phosphate isomerase [Nitrospirota bacterium]|jgi:methylthioribose-1-phosphate isomerase